MAHPTYAAPKSEPPGPRPHDPTAAALGNASLLGVGYLLLGRRRLAVVAAAVTVVLVCVLFRVARPWCEAVLLLWWAAVTAHGWFLAGGSGGRGGRGGRGAARGRRTAALGAACLVLLPAGFWRFDAAGIERDIAEAHRRGDCSRVLAAQDAVRLPHRVAGAPPAARGDALAEVCDRLEGAGARLGLELDDGTRAADTAEAAKVADNLKESFDVLASALAEPGNEKVVRATLEEFLGALPADGHCRTVTVTDWLRRRHPGQEALDRYAGAVERAVARTAPAALAGCGDDLADAGQWEEARNHYRRLLDRYPGDERADRARKGVVRATRAIELANVTRLLAGPGDEQSEYCSAPAKYSGAAPYRKGRANRALFSGPTEYTDRLPDEWRTAVPADAVLVVCVEQPEFGTPVRTCPYEREPSGSTRNVTFHKIAVPVKAYELRTGRLVADRTLEIGGTSCPGIITYYTVGDHDSGPPDQYVSPSDADVRAAFGPLVGR